MRVKKGKISGMRTPSAVTAALVLSIVNAGAGQLPAQELSAAANAEKQAMTARSKFYCNIKALNPAERLEHEQLSEKLVAVRKAVLEIEKGYEFQFSPRDTSVRELADWVAAESKCCPFFDFHIDVERDGALLCLRLTGEEVIKPFIRSEFNVPVK